MAVNQISKIQVRSGLRTQLPQLYRGELGWCIDTQELYIGTGTTEQGAPFEGVVLIASANAANSIVLETNGSLNSSQFVLNLVSGDNITLTDTGNGNISIKVSSGTPIQESLMGNINGNTTTFTSNHSPNQSYPYILVYNGGLLQAGYDFTVTGNAWTYSFVTPQIGDRQFVIYSY